MDGHHNLHNEAHRQTDTYDICPHLNENIHTIRDFQTFTYRKMGGSEGRLCLVLNVLKQESKSS